MKKLRRKLGRDGMGAMDDTFMFGNKFLTFLDKSFDIYIFTFFFQNKLVCCPINWLIMVNSNLGA